ncbi:ABC transporter ATP-binding protein [Desulfotomaculum sp. 1211_IL3151]|uniref:ABC transporter ATP-binding protein n=1 Tax=Desulfotomaculum sp. 1211_IL3151 TaxID=3084055 RepID=UPI002FDB8F92
MPLYQIQNLTFFYPESEKASLDKIQLNIEEGEFILVAGESGSGKSSLARVLAGLLPDFYGGRFGGKVYFKGQDIRKMDRRQLAGEVGMVFQDPEKQLVMTGLETEIAFGLENLGFSQQEMFRRVSEVIGFLDLTALKQKDVANLSGGQKQKIALASVLAMQPSVLILDEPTSQLDPVAAEELLNLIKRLNEELGFTVVLIEQRLERCFHLADRVIMMERGKVVKDAQPEQVARWAAMKGISIIPPVAKLFSRLGFYSVPITIKEGRKQLKKLFQVKSASAETNLPQGEKQCSERVLGQGTLLEVKKLWYAYDDGGEALRDINITIRQGEFIVILGENGAGKSTLLKSLVGLLQPGRGKVIFNHKDCRVAYLSQNPNDYLFQDTVEDELRFTLKNFKIRDEQIVNQLLEKLQLSVNRQVNPRDLSSGERQRVALASIMVTKPEFLVLDEPTRGLDYRLKDELANFLINQTMQGVSVVMVTHDIEFAAKYASRVIMMFDGRIVSNGKTCETFAGSIYYSTQMGKLFRGYCPGILTVQQAYEKIQPLMQERKTYQTSAERGI